MVSVLQPIKTPTGWAINQWRLHKALKFKFLYHYVKGEEWWRLYGDGRVFGKGKSTVLAINNIQYLKGNGFHSPKDQWPVALVYFGDDRTNMELNLEKLNINDWINDMQNSGNRPFLSADALFQKELTSDEGSEKIQSQFDVFTNRTTVEPNLQIIAKKPVEGHPSTKTKVCSPVIPQTI